MNLRTVETTIGIIKETFETALYLTIKREGVPILTNAFTVEVVDATQDLIDIEHYQLKSINMLLVDIGEPPLSNEEIFYYKLTKDQL